MRVVFMDRDGTMGPNASVEFPTQFSPFPNLVALINALQENMFLVMAVTNQSCIARKKDYAYDFNSEFAHYGLDDWFICPHDSQDGCYCRKPKPGLLHMAQKKYNGKIEMGKSFLIGDRCSDIEAGRACGVKTILVLTGRGKEEVHRCDGADYIAQNLSDAVEWILRQPH